MALLLRPSTNGALNNILDTMTGADGGGRYLMFLTALRAIDRQAAEGDPNAEAIVDLVLRFSRLIDITQNQQSNRYTNKVE